VVIIRRDLIRDGYRRTFEPSPSRTSPSDRRGSRVLGWA
jgi:hypothetical protein